MAVIDLRGGERNPWAQFLPQMFQRMAIMGLENKYAMEQLKVKATYDAQKTREEREYKEGRYDYEKNAEFEKQKELKGIPQAKEPIDINLNMQQSGAKQVYQSPGGFVTSSGAPVTSKDKGRIIQAGGKLWALQSPPKGHEWTFDAEKGFPKLVNTGTDAAKSEMQTIYGPDGQTKRVPVEKGTEYIPPEGWSLSKPTGDSKDQAIRTFELQNYGKLVPELRGTPVYINKLNESKKAGATNINIGVEKFDIQKQVTSGELRTSIISNKDDKDFYEANANVFNALNKKNEVSYWDKGDSRFYDEEAKIIKLSPQAISAGWTPKKIQDAADAKGKTVQEVLKEIGLLK